ncbi:MAG: 6-carboxytetrahydropterin synthase [Candidatus Omnitrophica bacterium]|nr:6-carboxytetrahydropterin synthase [Candidatus Omnitrophota bacterium]
MRKDGVIYLTKKVEFSASHRYHQPKLSVAENKKIFGKCFWPNGHGHNYALEVTIAGGVDPVTGMVMNIKQLKRFLQKVVQRLDHRYLNRDLPEFKRLVPTTENIARVLWQIILGQYPQLPLHRIRLTEGEELCVEYYGE